MAQIVAVRGDGTGSGLTRSGPVAESSGRTIAPGRNREPVTKSDEILRMSEIHVKKCELATDSEFDSNAMICAINGPNRRGREMTALVDPTNKDEPIVRIIADRQLPAGRRLLEGAATAVGHRIYR